MRAIGSDRGLILLISVWALANAGVMTRIRSCSSISVGSTVSSCESDSESASCWVEKKSARPVIQVFES
jgi:hypothetical protein